MNMSDATITYEGMVNKSFKGNSTFFGCSRHGSGYYHVVSITPDEDGNALTQAQSYNFDNQISLYFPLNAKSGEYEFSNPTKLTNFHIYVRITEDEQSYRLEPSSLLEGTIKFRGTYRGEFDATFEGDFHVFGKFNVQATPSSTCRNPDEF